jgi:multiple sugar transport system substrate-binding protein
MLGRHTRYKNDQMTETNFDHPLFAQGLQLIVDTMRTDKTAIPLEDEVGDKIDFAKAFISGKAAIAVDNVQIRIVKDTQTYPHDFVTAMIPAPVPGKEYMDNWKHDIGAGGGSDYVCISAKTQYPKEALDAFIWYLKGGSYPLAKGGRLPLWSGVDRNLVADALLQGADGVFNRESVLNYLSSINAGRAFPALVSPASAQIEKVWAEEMDAVLYGKKTASQAVKDAKTRADALIEKLAK